jgi:hypothetical protein
MLRAHFGMVMVTSTAKTPGQDQRRAAPLICHNICAAIEEAHELQISIPFLGEIGTLPCSLVENGKWVWRLNLAQGIVERSGSL